MKHFSHSAINTFKNCPRQYSYRYIERAPKLGKTIEAVLGSAVHESLEKLYFDKKKGKTLSLEELLVVFEKSWGKLFTDDVRIIKKEYEKEHYFEVGKKCITSYYNRYKPFENIVIGIEKVLYIPVDENTQMKCIIDRIDKNQDGVFEIHDYKTSQNLPTSEQINADGQLALYEIALKKAFQNTKSVALVWHYMVFDEELRVQKNDKELEDLWITVLESIKRIQNETEFKTRPSMLCSWCEYQNMCPETKHAYMLKYPTEQKQDDIEDGLNLVEEYIHYHGLKEEAKNKMEELKNKIVSLSDRLGVAVLSGNEKEIAIRKSDVAKLPRKEELVYEEMKNLVVDSGLYNDYSNLDIRKLAKDLNAEKVDAEIVNKFKKYPS